MKICASRQKPYPEDVDFCPRDGAPRNPVAAVSEPPSGARRSPLQSPHRGFAAVTETDAYLAASLARRFRLVRRFGQGGMGAVFLAEQIAVGNRPVALKVLNRKLLDDPDFLLRFQNEAASTGRIHHANVVTIYESGQADDGTPYIAMEFLEGESLRQALTRRGARQ
jgi:serine/threonine protein kinase